MQEDGSTASPATAATDVPSALIPEALTGRWPPRRLQVYEWLTLNAPLLVPVYEGAVLMFDDADFPGRVWFVAHAMRDMRNRLPDALAGKVKGSSTEYPKLAAEVSKCWIEDGWPESGSDPIVGEIAEPSDSGPPRREISHELFTAVGKLVAGDLAITPRKKENARRLFGAAGGEIVPEYVIAAWLAATKRAEPFAHVRNQPLTSEDVQDFESAFRAFEDALGALAKPAYENLDDLDAILGSANS